MLLIIKEFLNIAIQAQTKKLFNKYNDVVKFDEIISHILSEVSTDHNQSAKIQGN